MDEEKKGSVEEAAEKTGEVVGKGVKKGWGVVKAFDKGRLYSFKNVYVFLHTNFFEFLWPDRGAHFTKVRFFQQVHIGS